MLDNGFELYVSRAICRYYFTTLGSGPDLVPTDPGPARSPNLLANSSSELQASSILMQFDPLVGRIIYKTLVKVVVSSKDSSLTRQS